MLVAFELTMPVAASWNGKWSGDERRWIVIEKLNDSDAERVLSAPSYSYRWTDGWCARIAVRAVDSREARKLRSVSSGFYGYEWMVKSIINYGRIYADHEIPEDARFHQPLTPRR